VLYEWKDVSLHITKNADAGCYEVVTESAPSVKNRRKYPRLTIADKCNIELQSSKETFSGAMVNISANGFAFTVKNVHGTEITGTNSMFEKAFLSSVKAGEIKEVSFRQKMDLQGGEYLLSLGLTGYNGDVFEVYHRLYDVVNITVISDKNTVGYYDMNARITVKDA
jgi:hypothetical protein